jgi:prolyl 4-hydroxylase
MELPQVGRYLTTQQYLPHYDAFNVDEADGARFAANGGQRTVTVLVYLNDVSSGGHTAFPQLKGGQHQHQHHQHGSASHQQLEIRPSRGTALVFFPATVDGHLDPRTLHAALPAVDTKFVSQVWIRQGN